jgi:DNA-binding FadR family transcriptional regulator
MGEMLMLETMPPRGRLADQVAQRLERLILDGHVQPGEKLPTQAQLCEQLNVSRTVVREAMQMLVSKGLLQMQRGTGTTVRPVSHDALASSLSRFLERRDGKIVFRDLHQVRCILELATARLAARYATAGDIAELRQIVIDLDRLCGDSLAFARRDADFHRKVAEATQNSLLMALLDSMRDLLQDYILSTLPHVEIGRDVLPDHRRILERIEAHDPVGARQAMWEHITSAPWERDQDEELMHEDGGPAADLSSPRGQLSAVGNR